MDAFNWRFHAIVGITFLMFAPAMAQTAREAEAVSFFKAGRLLYDTGDYAAAMQLFDRARERAPHKPVPYLWLAKSIIRLGRCDEAAGFIKEFNQRVAFDDARRTELEQELDACLQPPPAPAATVKPPQPAPAAPRPLPIVDEKPVPSTQPGRGSGRTQAMIAGVIAGTVVLGVGIGVGLGYSLRNEAIAPTDLGAIDLR